MSIGAANIMAKLRSHAGSLGVFANVVGHEPLNAPPGNGVTAAFWTERLPPIPQASGLAVTSLRWEVQCRIYNPAQQYPVDDIDPNIVEAAVALMAAYSGDFDLGGLVSLVDLLGAYGPPMSCEAGYLQQDEVLFRAVVVSIPLILFDVLAQVS